jgi:tetratricopeptide (TPR) repeat protein
MEKFEDAIPVLEECLSFQLKLEDRSNLLSNLGLCYSGLKNYHAARDCFLQACKIGLSKGLEGHVHLNLAVACAHLNLFPDAKREFQICEERAADYHLQIHQVYGWLSWFCKGLGEKAESERYARLARPC